MSRNSRHSIRAALERGEVISLDHLRAAGVQINTLLARTGTVPHTLKSFLDGKAPAGWVQREIATALRVEPEELWPA